MWAACTDSSVTGRGVCTGRFVRMLAACTASAVTGRDVFTGRLVRMCVCLSVCRCCVSVRGAWLSLYKMYVSPKFHLYRSHASSAERERFCFALVVYPKELTARALGCNFYRTDSCSVYHREPRRSGVRHHDHGLSFAFTDVRKHHSHQGRLWETAAKTFLKRPRHMAYVVTEYVYPGCMCCLYENVSRRIVFGIPNRPQSGHTGLRCLLSSGPYQSPPHVSRSLSNAAWDSLTCSVRSGLSGRTVGRPLRL